MIHEFVGYVVEISGDEIFVCVEESTNKNAPSEQWVINKKQVPETWLAIGAVFKISISDNECWWSFSRSTWTEEEIAKIKKDAEELNKFFSINGDNNA